MLAELAAYIGGDNGNVAHYLVERISDFAGKRCVTHVDVLLLSLHLVLENAIVQTYQLESRARQTADAEPGLSDLVELEVRTRRGP